MDGDKECLYSWSCKANEVNCGEGLRALSTNLT